MTVDAETHSAPSARDLGSWDAQRGVHCWQLACALGTLNTSKDGGGWRRQSAVRTLQSEVGHKAAVNLHPHQPPAGNQQNLAKDHDRRRSLRCTLRGVHAILGLGMHSGACAGCWLPKREACWIRARRAEAHSTHHTSRWSNLGKIAASSAGTHALRGYMRCWVFGCAAGRTSMRSSEDGRMVMNSEQGR